MRMIVASFTSLALVALLCFATETEAFSSSGGSGRVTSAQQLKRVIGLGPHTDAADADALANDDKCQVLLLDHLNINHEKGRHDALKAFYFDFLGCAIDPRKYENYLEGKKVSM